MGHRNGTNGNNKTARLAVKKETLRALQLRTLTDDELRAAPGGWNTGTCGGGAPSCNARC